MALPISVTYTFATATSAIPLSQLDANFTTVVNGVNGIGNGTNALSNVLITGGTIDGATIGATTSSTGRFSTVTATTGNITTINATTTNSATVRADGNLTFQSNGTTTAMTIDTSQNVGIGTSSPSFLAGYAGLQVNSATGTEIRLTNSTVGTASTDGMALYMSTAGDGFVWNNENANLRFATNNSERMRIDSSGRVGVGITSGFNAQLTVAKTAVSSFTGNTSGTLMVADPSATLNYFTTLDFTANQYYPIARIASQYTGGGSYLSFGTSNNYTNGVTNTAMTINPTGNVGIGTSSPSADTTYKWLNIVGPSTSGGGIVQLNNSDSSVGINMFCNNLAGYVGTSTSHPLLFRINSSEAARIDSSGNLLVGLTSSLAGAKASFYQNNASTSWAGFFQAQNTFGCLGITNVSGTASYTAVGFYNNGTSYSSCGAITVSGTTTTYATSSDYRLKKSIAPMTSGLATVSALKPITYKWNADDSDGEGFIAHELQEVIPHAVVGEKDAVDENGKIKPQGVDYSKLVVHLVAAIQELKAELDALKGTK